MSIDKNLDPDLNSGSGNFEEVKQEIKEQTHSALKNYPILKFFTYEHLKNLEMRETSKKFCDLAEYVVCYLPDGAEKSTALRKLLEAKDCAVRTLL